MTVRRLGPETTVGPTWWSTGLVLTIVGFAAWGTWTTFVDLLHGGPFGDDPRDPVAWMALPAPPSTGDRVEAVALVVALLLLGVVAASSLLRSRVRVVAGQVSVRSIFDTVTVGRDEVRYVRAGRGRRTAAAIICETGSIRGSRRLVFEGATPRMKRSDRAVIVPSTLHAEQVALALGCPYVRAARSLGPPR